MAAVEEQKVSEPGTAPAAVAETAGDVVMADDENDKMVKACKQMEFYFADSNLPFDKFMWALHTANPEHWVPISTVASFKRMRDFMALGLEWVVKALSLSEELEIDETATKVRRRTDVQEPKDQFQRSVYAKGLGKEEPGLQQELETYFSKFGKINAMRMRRMDGSKEFKGSVFVEFADFKSVDAFLNADPKPSWDGEDLLIMSKEAYCDMKIKEKGITGKAAATRKENMATRKGFNAFRDMTKAKGDKGKAGEAEKPKAEVWLEFMGSRIRVYDEDGGTVRDADVPHVPGATLRFEGCGAQVRFGEIKDALRERFARAPFIKYTRGDDHGFVGFDKAVSDADLAFVRGALKQISAHDVSWAAATDDDDRACQLERAKTAARAVLGNSKTGGGGSSRGGRGGRGRGGRGDRGGRGGRGGGRGGGRDKGMRNADGDKPAPAANADEQAGEKRKRAVEPDGGPDVGVRGQGAPPAIQSAKKVRADGEGSS